MAKIFQLLAVALATLSAIISNVVGNELIDAAPKERFKILDATITGIPNEYISFAKVELSPDHMYSTTTVHIIKELPADLVVEVRIKYQGQDLPPVIIPVCSGMNDPLFVNDVVTRGEPKETFPHECPIKPGNYTVRNWEFPHYKIPPGTPPGDVYVIIMLKTDKDEAFHFESHDEVIIVIPNAPPISLGK